MLNNKEEFERFYEQVSILFESFISRVMTGYSSRGTDESDCGCGCSAREPQTEEEEEEEETEFGPDKQEMEMLL